jgi:hypothetical protein
MSVPRCGDCRHWGRQGDTGRYRVCGAVEHDEGGYAGTDEPPRWCSDDSRTEWSRINQLKAVACDGSGYSAALVARDDFGCVLFEPVTPPSA